MSTPIPVIVDTVAVNLAFSEEYLVRELGVRVTDEAYTVVDETAKRMRVALNWENLGAYKEFLVNRLVGG